MTDNIMVLAIPNWVAIWAISAIATYYTLSAVLVVLEMISDYYKRRLRELWEARKLLAEELDKVVDAHDKVKEERKRVGE